MKLAWRIAIGGLAVAAILVLGGLPIELLELSASLNEMTSLEPFEFPVTEKMVADPLDSPLLRRFFLKYNSEVTRKIQQHAENDLEDNSGNGDSSPNWTEEGECSTERTPLDEGVQETEVLAKDSFHHYENLLFPQIADRGWQKIFMRQDLNPSNGFQEKTSSPALSFFFNVPAAKTTSPNWFRGGERNTKYLFRTIPPPRLNLFEHSTSIGEVESTAQVVTNTRSVLFTAQTRKINGIGARTTSHESTLLSNLNQHCYLSGIVTVQDGGRLGNKLWEYAAVWALGHTLNLRPLVPLTLIRYLRRYFKDLSVGTLEDAFPQGCQTNPEILGEPMKRWRLFPLTILKQRVRHSNGGNLVLHRWILLPEPVIALRGNPLRKEFQFHQRFVDEAERTLKWAAKEVIARKKYENCTMAKVTYVGVHVRRTDFAQWLPRVYNKSLASANYFHKAMGYFQKIIKGPIAFLVATDDPPWVKVNLGARKINSSSLLSTGKNNVFLGTREGDHTSESIGHDLALLSLCNHSIIDYGTFGAWGALMAGGKTISLHSDQHLDSRLASSIPDWMIWDDPGT